MKNEWSLQSPLASWRPIISFLFTKKLTCKLASLQTKGTIDSGRPFFFFQTRPTIDLHALNCLQVCNYSALGGHEIFLYVNTHKYLHM